MKTISIGKIAEFLETKAPVQTAESWDSVGLLVGDRHWRTSGAVICDDLTPSALEEAIRRKYRLIVNHHPCIFPASRGLSRVVAGKKDSLESLIFEAVRKGVAVYASHTNFDQCAVEVIEEVSKAFGVSPIGRLNDRRRGCFLKLVVFVPHEAVDRVRSAITDAGAGQIGAYDTCTFEGDGTGRVRGLEGAHPSHGKIGQVESVKEIRIETILPQGLRDTVLRAMQKAHPYEEVAFDLYPVEQGPMKKGIVKGQGYGFYGQFKQGIRFSTLARRVKTAFQTDGFFVTQPQPDQVHQVAFVAGKGASFVGDAISKGCDVMITGEAGYHAALEGARGGMAVIEVGHRESEFFFLKVMKEWLAGFGLKTSVNNQKTQTIWTSHGKGEPA